ncbi:MAG: PucR family transcriptional regulator, purine catabolism regulatory protein [Tepidanaerobacteraceae bacterium]|nr:PucR family transcriptional regulator, purine catabolism regulatory protein [Tepidanaerobacteraceae bacterium]
MEGITVKEAYEILKEDGVYWAGGRNGENRIIKSVSVIEIPDCLEWLQGGEMILTTLYPYKTVDERLNLIKSLSKGEAACICIHPGNDDFPHVPDCLIKLADEINFPLLLIDRKLPYSLIMKKTYEALLNREEMALKKAHEINNVMNNILLTNGGAHEIIEKFSAIINCSVICLDENFKPLDMILRGKDGGLKEEDLIKIYYFVKSYIETYSLHKTNKNKPDKTHIVSWKDGVNLAISIMNINDETAYYLLVIKRGEMTEFDKKLYEIALPGTITALKIDILKNLAILETEQRLKSDFFEDVINDAYTSNELMKKRARTLGLNLLDKNFVVIFDIDDFEKYCRDNYEKGEQHIQKIKRDLKKAIEEACKNIKNRVLLFVPKSDAGIILVGFTRFEYMREVIYKKILKDLFYKTIAEFSARNPDVSLSAGVSSAMENIEELKRAYNEAIFAIDIGTKLFGKGKINFYDDLGIYKLISIPDKKEDILRDRWFSRLYEHDINKNGNLIETLEVFLDTNGSIKDTAKKLYTHPNTIKYRLKKIRELSGEDILQDEQKRLYYHILIKALKMLS